jgi:hypothetical protein
MSRKEETVYPSEVLAAVAYAKKKDPSDKFGDKAFQLNATPRDGKNGTRWLSLSILKKKNNKWDYIPLRLRAMNVKTTAHIKTDEEKKEKKQDFPGMSLSYNTKSTGANEEPYGAAKLAISRAFSRMMTAIIKSGDIYIENKTVKLNVQTSRWVNKAKGEKEKIEDGIIRVKIPFNQENNSIAKNAVPNIQLYDVEKKKPADESGKVKGVPFMPAVDKDGNPLTYSTIPYFIRCGSSTSFVEDLSGVCLSSQCASNPAKLDSFLIIKKGNGNKITADDAYSQDDFAIMEGAETGGDETPTEPKEETTVAEPGDFDDMEGLGDESEEVVEAPKVTKKSKKKVVVSDDDELDDLDD